MVEYGAGRVEGSAHDRNRNGNSSKRGFAKGTVNPGATTTTTIGPHILGSAAAVVHGELCRKQGHASTP